MSATSGFQVSLVAVFLTFALGATSTRAQNSYAKSSSDPQTASGLQVTNGQEYVRVVGHLPLNGMLVNQMFVQQRASKVYLYLHRSAKQAYAAVDVTNPGDPVLLNRVTLKEAKGTEVDTAAGSVLAIAVTPESVSAPQSSANAPLATETIQFVDMSNPKNLKSVKTFKGVTSVYPDDARKLVYLVNGDGLWIVSHHMSHPLPMCNSESALIPEPDCQ